MTQTHRDQTKNQPKNNTEEEEMEEEETSNKKKKKKLNQNGKMSGRTDKRAIQVYEY